MSLLKGDEVCVHCFMPEARAYYSLEDLWSGIEQRRQLKRRKGKDKDAPPLLPADVVKLEDPDGTLAVIVK
jgi:hypothetical protein